MALTLLASALAATISGSSAYTSLLERNCQDQTANAPTDYFVAACPGRDGLGVKYEGGDGRSWIGLFKKGESPADGPSYADLIAKGAKGAFANVHGRNLEWRYVNRKLVALIVRTSATALDENTSIENLVVLRVDPANLANACLVGVVDTKAEFPSNAAARAMADDLKRPCL